MHGTFGVVYVALPGEVQRETGVTDDQYLPIMSLSPCSSDTCLVKKNATINSYVNLCSVSVNNIEITNVELSRSSLTPCNKLR